MFGLFDCFYTDFDDNGLPVSTIKKESNCFRNVTIYFHKNNPSKINLEIIRLRLPNLYRKEYRK